jgi:AraC family transcriptional activator of pobA
VITPYLDYLLIIYDHRLKLNSKNKSILVLFNQNEGMRCQMDKQELIPKFSLYGESQDHYDSDLVHIESIAARSKKSHWNIQPHLHGKLFQVIIIISGNAEILLDNRDYTLKGNGAVIIPSGVVHSFRFPPQTDGYVLTIAESLINHSTTSRAVDYLNFGN